MPRGFMAHKKMRARAHTLVFHGLRTPCRLPGRPGLLSAPDGAGLRRRQSCRAQEEQSGSCVHPQLVYGDDASMAHNAVVRVHESSLQPQDYLASPRPKAVSLPSRACCVGPTPRPFSRMQGFYTANASARCIHGTREGGPRVILTRVTIAKTCSSDGRRREHGIVRPNTALFDRRHSRNRKLFQTLHSFCGIKVYYCLHTRQEPTKKNRPLRSKDTERWGCQHTHAKRPEGASMPCHATTDSSPTDEIQQKTKIKRRNIGTFETQEEEQNEVNQSPSHPRIVANTSQAFTNSPA